MDTLALSRFVAAVSVVAMLSACNGGGAIGTVPTAPAPVVARGGAGDLGGRTQCGWLSPIARKEKRLIYVGNGGEILVFPERPHNPSAVGCISTPVDSSHGIYVDRHGSLYVTNGNSTVTVYPRGSLAPSATYSTGTDGPLYPVVDRTGDLFVSTCCHGIVLKFPHGGSRSQVLQTPGYEVDGMAVDGANNLYVAYRTTLYAGSIEKFAPGSSQGTILGMAIVQPQGLLVTSDGTIVLVQTGRADGVYVFPPGSQTPSLKLTVGDTPVQLALTEPAHKLLLSAFGDLGSGRVYQVPYPLTTSSSFHVKLAFRLRHDGHRRRNRFQIQGLALGNGQAF